MKLDIKKRVDCLVKIKIADIEEYLKTQLMNTGELSSGDQVNFCWVDGKGTELIDFPEEVVVTWEHKNGKDQVKELRDKREIKAPEHDARGLAPK